MSINENLRNRMIAEAEEAEAQNLIKVAEHLTKQIERNPVRKDDEKYVYSRQQFQDDVETYLWDIVTRASDFYGKHIDANDAHKIVANAAANIVEDLKNVAGVEHGVGKYEPPVLGEVKEQVIMEISDD